MIITRTPFRLSFFGGGTDYPVYFNQQDGQVLSTSIDKYCYITARWLPPFFDHKYRIRYTNREEVNQIEDIEHPAVRACFEFLNIDKGVEITHTSDIPAMSGVGSSSSFTVGLLHALYTLKKMDISKSELCQNAVHIEQNILGENVGSQDQSVAAYGGLNKIIFKKDKSPIVSPITIGRDRRKSLENHLMLFFTGFSRIASTIAAEQIKNTPDKIPELNLMKSMVDESLLILESENTPINLFGELLHASWQLKKQLTDKISNDNIDEIYNRAIEAGAIGGKLCGAGAGGFMLLFVAPEKQKQVKYALSNLTEVPFSFDQKGTEVIFKS